MKILITGGSGFIGSALAKRLASKHNVYCLSDELSSLEKLRGLRVKTILADITKGKQLKETLKPLLPFDVVFHLAAVKTAARPIPTDADCWRINTQGTRNVCAAIGKPKRIIYAGSILSYGNTPSRNPIPESAKCVPANAYAASKLEGEKIIARSGIPFTIVRIAIGYGPNDTGTVLKIISFVQKMKVVPVIAGEKELHLAYVDDIVDAFVKMLASPKTINKTYNIAGPEAVTMRGLIAMAERELGVTRFHVPLSAGLTRALLVPYEKISGDPIVTRDQLDTLLSGKILDIRKAREFGWAPKTSAKQGVAKTVAWLKKK